MCAECTLMPLYVQIIHSIHNFYVFYFVIKIKWEQIYVYTYASYNNINGTVNTMVEVIEMKMQLN